MIGIYKLIFDLALYYSLTGFYLSVLFDAPPSTAGMASLILVVLLDGLLRHKNVKVPALRIAVLILPFFILLTRPALWSFIHVLPAWAYIGYSILTGRYVTDLDDFKKHFGFGVRIQLLMIPAFIIIVERAVPAFVAVIPFLSIMLASGVCLLRMLRENTESGARQAMYILIFVFGCTLLTLGRAPQMVGAVFTAIYKWLLAPVILVATLVLGFGIYVIFEGMFWLISLFRKETEQEEVKLDLRSAAEVMGFEDLYEDASDGSPIFRIIVYTLLAAGIGYVLFIFFRKMIGKRKKGSEKTIFEESQENAQPTARRRGFGLTRPRDPRLAVRYYYARFLRECGKRYVDLSPGMTSEDVLAACRFAFPGADPSVLQQIYLPARYSNLEAVTAADADAAAAAWHTLRRTKSPYNPKQTAR